MLCVQIKLLDERGMISPNFLHEPNSKDPTWLRTLWSTRSDFSSPLISPFNYDNIYLKYIYHAQQRKDQRNENSEVVQKWG